MATYYHVAVDTDRNSDGTLYPVYITTENIFRALSLIDKARKISEQLTNVSCFYWAVIKDGVRVEEHKLF